jgi:hypothetical protein
VTALFAKLNHKGQSPIHVLNAPASFDGVLAELAGVTVHRTVTARDVVTFGMAFAVTQQQLDTLSAALAKAAAGDAIVWIAYPKGTSKRYRCEFNRDAGWGVLAAAGFEGVRMVAIDEDWSALRFRRVEFVKNMTRAPERRLTETAKTAVKQAVNKAVKSGTKASTQPPAKKAAKRR